MWLAELRTVELAQQPRRVKKRKASSEPGGMTEEYFDYIFPGETEGAGGPKLKILEMAL